MRIHYNYWYVSALYDIKRWNARLTQETNVISSMVSPACRTGKICQVSLNSAHSARLQFYDATLHWLEIWSWIINAVYSDTIKMFILGFFYSFSCRCVYICSPYICNTQWPPLLTDMDQSWCWMWKVITCTEILTFSIVCHTYHTDVNSYKIHWNNTDQEYITFFLLIFYQNH